jgi:hypothetical protein
MRDAQSRLAVVMTVRVKMILDHCDNKHHGTRRRQET